jgi:hypothetical protein
MWGRKKMTTATVGGGASGFSQLQDNGGSEPIAPMAALSFGPSGTESPSPSLRETVKTRLLNDMIHGIGAQRGGVVMCVDNFTLRMLSSVIKMSELLDDNIQACLPRQPQPPPQPRSSSSPSLSPSSRSKLQPPCLTHYLLRCARTRVRLFALHAFPAGSSHMQSRPVNAIAPAQRAYGEPLTPRSRGAQLVENITMRDKSDAYLKRQPMPGMSALYFITPTVESVNRFLFDYRNRKRHLECRGSYSAGLWAVGVRQKVAVGAVGSRI